MLESDSTPSRSTSAVAVPSGGSLGEHAAQERRLPVPARPDDARRVASCGEREQALDLLLAVDHVLRRHVACDGKRVHVDPGHDRKSARSRRSCLLQAGNLPATCRRSGRVSGGVRVWIDVTNSPHVPFFRPLVALLQERGHEVAVTARAFAQTLELLEAARDRARRRRPTPRRSDAGREGPGDGLAAARAPSLGARALARPRAVPCLARAPAHGAVARHPIGVRLRLRVRARPAPPRLPGRDARRRAGGDPAGAPRRARRPGAQGAALRRVEGGVLPARVPAGQGVLTSLGLDRTRVLVVVRTPPDVSLYHRHGNPLFTQVLERLADDPLVQTVVLPRTAEQRDADRSTGSPGRRRARARGRRARASSRSPTWSSRPAAR